MFRAGHSEITVMLDMLGVVAIGGHNVRPLSIP
jgi:hypothetical protein